MTDTVPHLTYKDLDSLLRVLGFTVSEPEPGTRVYQHAESGAQLFFPVLPDRDRVRPHHLLGTRTTLDTFGVLEAGEFDDRVKQAAA
jgi:hypothetical protein